MTITTVRFVGYRERVALKAYLLSVGKSGDWPAALDAWRYDASRDVLMSPERSVHNTIGGPPTRVRMHEGNRSREILAEHGSDDRDCLVSDAL